MTLKKSNWIILALIITGLSYAQSKKIESVNTFSVRNSGAIIDNNNNVSGYFFFYAMDKVKKKDWEFGIKILDNNLVEVAQKSYIDNKETTLMKSAFNNQAMIFAMKNDRESKITLVSFDKQANPRPTIEIPYESGELRWVDIMNTSSDFNTLLPIENKGFLFNKITDNKKLGYSLKYYPTDGGKAWEYNSDEKSKEWLMLNPIEGNQDVVVALEYSKTGMLSQKANISVLAIDTNTGKLLFQKDYNKKTNPRTVTNAYLNKNSIIIMGEYFAPEANIVKDKGLGFFAEEIDMTGKTINESLVSWKDDVDKILKESGNEELGYVMFHDIIKTGNGEYYAIGERYKKNSKGAGALSIVGLPAGSMVITDAMFFKFDKNFKLNSIQKFEKGKSQISNIAPMGTPQINAYIAKALGRFDYGFTQVDTKNDRFYSLFLDSDRAGVKSKKVTTAFKAIIYDDGELSEDRIALSSEDDPEKRFRILPAKVGSIVLVEYDEKTKTITIRLEKLNIK